MTSWSQKWLICRSTFFSAADPDRVLVSNVGTMIVKKLTVKFKGNEILDVDDFDVLA